MARAAPPAAPGAQQLHFEKLVDLITKYDNAQPRDLDLLAMLVGTLKSSLTSRENVFVKMMTSTAHSVHSQTQRMDALSRHGFDRLAKTSSGLTLLERKPPSFDRIDSMQ